MTKINSYVIYEAQTGQSPELDVLCIAPHPDDAELFCGGSLLSFSQQGLKVGLADLSKGELASNGTVETRRAESVAASKELFLYSRYNLELPDTAILAGDELQRDRLVALIRNTKPKLLLLPYGDSRHPDHENARKLCDDALFFANLAAYKLVLGERCTVHAAVYYMLRTKFEPSFLIDITETREQKHKAIHCHQSQVLQGKNKTLVSDPMSISSITARDAFYGSQVGVESAEPFYVPSPLLISNPHQFFTQGKVQKSFLRNA